MPLEWTDTAREGKDGDRLSGVNVGGCQHQHASEKNSSFAGLLEGTCCNMNKTT